jgi:hypothetical protein
MCSRALLLYRLLYRLPAELYGPDNAARARLTFDIYPPDENTASGSNRSSSGGSTSGAGSGKEEAQFVLNWRIPG